MNRGPLKRREPHAARRRCVDSEVGCVWKARDRRPPPRPGAVMRARPVIVPDATWPGMYRIRLHGLSDMANLTRIKDELAWLLAPKRRTS